MTEPSQYFKGRTVQEQMDEVIGYVDTRAAEVATNAIASDVAQVHQDMLDADADASAAAASAAAAAGTLANAVKKTGEASQSIAGDIAVAGDLTGGTVTVPAPVNNTDAASKKYVDDQNALDVKLAGNQTIADVKTFSSSPVVPTVATGTADTKAANGTKVKNELDAYVPMVRDTGNKVIAGNKTFTDNATMGAHRVIITTPNKWKRIFTTPKRAGGVVRTWVFAYSGVGTANTYAGLLQMSIAGTTEVPTLTWLVKGSSIPANSVAATVYDGVLNIWVSNSCALSCIGYATRSALEGAQLTPIDEATEYDDPQNDAGFITKYGVVVG